MAMTFKEWRAEVAKAKVMLDMTYEALAIETGYSASYVANVVCGRQIGQPCMDAISTVLGIKPYRYKPEDLSLIRETR